MTFPNDRPRDSGNIPLWAISTWIYKDYPGAASDELCSDGSAPTSPGVCQNGSAPIFNQTAWLNSVQSAITAYNKAQISPSSQISQIYPYASDLELPWVAPSYAGNGVSPEPLFATPPVTTVCPNKDGQPLASPALCYNRLSVPPSTYWDLSDPTLPTCSYGLSFVETTINNALPPALPAPQPGPPVNPPAANQAKDTTPVPPSLTIPNLNISEMAIIIDGRIDNGYLQGLNEFLTPTDAQNLAKLIVNGGYSQIPLVLNPNWTTKSQPSVPKKILGNSNFQVGVGTFGPLSSNKYSPTINGIQLDLEPFDSTNPNQVAFYKEIGSLLAANGQYYSIFTFPKAMTEATASVLNSSNNGYMIVALYDLLDMASIPLVCTADYTFTGAPCDTSAAPPPVVASGDATSAIYDTTVPHSLAGYYNAVLLTVMQTIAKAAQTGIKYKFGIPVSASVHEFEGWGQYVCQFNDYEDVKPINGFCRMYNGLPMNINSGNPTQLGYIQMALKAISDGIGKMKDTFTSNASLFRGIDLYAFSYRTIWSPQNPVVDYDTGNVFYGNTPVYVPASDDGYSQGSQVNAPYIYSLPGYPTYSQTDYANSQNILNYLATYGIDPRPATCGTGSCLPNQCCNGSCCPIGTVCIGSGTCCSRSYICGTGTEAICCNAEKPVCTNGTCIAEVTT